MTAELTSQRYSVWYSMQCQQECVPAWGDGRRAVVFAAAKAHVRETGHETAVVGTASVHFRLEAKS